MTVGSVRVESTEFAMGVFPPRTAHESASAIWAAFDHGLTNSRERMEGEKDSYASFLYGLFLLGREYLVRPGQNGRIYACGIADFKGHRAQIFYRRGDPCSYFVASRPAFCSCSCFGACDLCLPHHLSCDHHELLGCGSYVSHDARVLLGRANHLSSSPGFGCDLAGTADARHSGCHLDHAPDLDSYASSCVVYPSLCPCPYPCVFPSEILLPPASSAQRFPRALLPNDLVFSTPQSRSRWSP
jgi:hypothetical protein